MPEGWQQKGTECLHFGLLGAILTIGMQPVGGEWKCRCGKVYVVAMKDDMKTLVPK